MWYVTDRNNNKENIKTRRATHHLQDELLEKITMAMTSCPVFVLAHDGSSTFFTARSLKKDEPHEHGTKAKKVHDRKEKGGGPGLLIMG